MLINSINKAEIIITLLTISINVNKAEKMVLLITIPAKP